MSLDAGAPPFGSHVPTSAHPEGGGEPQADPRPSEVDEHRQRVRAAHKAEARRRRQAASCEAPARRRRDMERERLTGVLVVLGKPKRAEAVRRCETTAWLVDETGAHVLGPNGHPIRLVDQCGHRQCPYCARKRYARARDVYEHLVAEHFTCKRPAFMTFTTDAKGGEALSVVADRMKRAWKRLTRRKRFKATVRGGIRALEVTYNKTLDRWHLHMHVLADVDWLPQQELLSMWRESMGYAPDDKQCGARIERSRKGIAEVVKYTTKGLDASGLPDDKLRELTEWLSGTRVVQTFGHLYGVKVDLDDETPTTVMEGAEDDPDSDVVGYSATTGDEVTADQVLYVQGPEHDEEGYRLLRRYLLREHEHDEAGSWADIMRAVADSEPR